MVIMEAHPKFHERFDGSCHGRATHHILYRGFEMLGYGRTSRKIGITYDKIIERKMCGLPPDQRPAGPRQGDLERGPAGTGAEA